MKFLGNIIWLILGGLEAAIGYFSASLGLFVTIIGIPWALETVKIGVLCLWPFGATVIDTKTPTGCVRIPLNIVWLLCGGLLAWISHILFGALLCITIVGIPWGKQHFKMARLSLAPFGKDIVRK